MKEQTKKVLHLTLKKKWFDLILSGEKKEEYREIKPYWVNRLCENFEAEYPYFIETICRHMIEEMDNTDLSFDFKKFSTICFRNGYAKNSPTITIECIGIEISEGKTEWGAEPNTKYFVIKLGSIIKDEFLSTF
jgi:hypothetical protein